MKIIRVFPRRTSMTPDDELVRIAKRPGLFDEADEIHISVTFSWDMPLAEKLAEMWKYVAPVQIGGPATGMAGGEFTPGLYIKKGNIITSRGCDNYCWHCDVWKREGRLHQLKIHEGVNVLDDNWISCTNDHQRETIEKIKVAKKIYKKPAEFTGGLEAARFTREHASLLREVNPKQMFFAYDTPDDLEPLHQAGKFLFEQGWSTAGHFLRAYVLVGWPENKNRGLSADTFKEASQRIRETIEAGFLPMAMLYRDPKYGTKSPEWTPWQRIHARPSIIAKQYDTYHKSKEK